MAFEVANATTATHLARSRGSRHTPKFCAHLLESRSPPAAPTQCTFVVIAARKKMCGKSHIVRGLHPQILPEVRGGHRTCRRPVRTAESTLPRSLDMISKRNKATHGNLCNLQMRFVVSESLSGLVASCRTRTPSMAGAALSRPSRGHRTLFSWSN